jgi:hypothetical protein
MSNKPDIKFPLTHGEETLLEYLSKRPLREGFMDGVLRRKEALRKSRGPVWGREG